MGIRTYLKLINAEFPALAWAWMIYCKLLMPRECFAFAKGVGVMMRGLYQGSWVSCKGSILGRGREQPSEQWLFFEPRVVATSWPVQMGIFNFFSFVLMLIWVRGNGDPVAGWRKPTWTWINKSNPLPPTCNFQNLIWIERLELDFCMWRKLLTSLLFMVKSPNLLPEEMCSSQQIKTSFFF